MSRNLILLILLVGGCKDPFVPPASSDPQGYMAVDGYINASDSSATVMLTHAINLSSQSFPTIDDALVFVEDENGISYQIPYDSNGIYGQKRIPFDLTKKYRLKIELSNQKRYSSEFEAISQVPSIDSLWWEPVKEGISIKLNSHGTEEDSRFYTWRFVETWLYHSALQTFLDVVNDVVVPRNYEDQIYWCWKSVNSTQILLKSTEGLSQNLVNDFQIAFLPAGTDKLLQEYSILVQQYAMSEKAYTFRSELKKTTENLGGLFDPLPFKVLGNITNINDPDEIVLGYFSAVTVSEKRIFIPYYKLPGYMQDINLPDIDCKAVAIPFADIPNRDKSLIPFADYGQPVTLGYLFASRECVDCRESGGTKNRPSFWQ